MSELILILLLLLVGAGILIYYHHRRQTLSLGETPPTSLCEETGSGDAVVESPNKSNNGRIGETSPDIHQDEEETDKPNDACHEEPPRVLASADWYPGGADGTLSQEKPSRNNSKVPFVPSAKGQEVDHSDEEEQEKGLPQIMATSSQGDEAVVPQPDSEYEMFEEVIGSNLNESQDQETPKEDSTGGDEDLLQQQSANDDLKLSDEGIEIAEDISLREEEGGQDASEKLVGSSEIGTDAEVEIPEESTSVAATKKIAADSVISKKKGLDPSSGQSSKGKEKSSKKKKPQTYQGLNRGAPEPQNNKRQTPYSNGREPAMRDRSLPIEVRLRFEHGDFCRVTLIAKRAAGMPEEVTIATTAGEAELRAMQDEWYQDVTLDSISRVLQDGTVWTQNNLSGQCNWSLSGRGLYVLADRPNISGYISQPCLELGRDHAVLCTETIRRDVEEAIKKTNAVPKAVLDDSLGAPPGWIVFRGVVPRRAVDPVTGTDIFNALRPLPQIDISLEHGIRLEYANWLLGYPPLIRVYGDPEHTEEVRIDGQIAVCDEYSNYQAPGWDSIGLHTIWCSDISKSYAIVPFDATWDQWVAYAFTVINSSKRSLAICGPMVRCVSDGSQRFSSVSVPETNPVLLGHAPGHYGFAENVSGAHGTLLIASPFFSPVWALPRDPLHCDKETTRILLIGEKVSPEATNHNFLWPAASSDPSIKAWCRLILDANRKGMKTQPDTDSVRALWLQYKRMARYIWRANK